MFEAGLGGALFSDVNAGIRQGLIEYESDEWLNVLVHTVDAFNKKGLLAAMHNMATLVLGAKICPSI